MDNYFYQSPYSGQGAFYGGFNSQYPSFGMDSSYGNYSFPGFGGGMGGGFNPWMSMFSNPYAMMFSPWMFGGGFNPWGWNQQYGSQYDSSQYEQPKRAAQVEEFSTPKTTTASTSSNNPASSSSFSGALNAINNRSSSYKDTLSDLYKNTPTVNKTSDVVRDNSMIRFQNL